ncbi:MAG: hypothetical protein AAFX87_31525 [Bacteroidota bacterium]
MKYVYLLLASAALLSCSPQAFVPQTFDPLKDKEPVAIAATDEYVVFLENLRRKSNMLIFDLEVQNNSGAMVEVDLSRIYCYMSNQPFKPIPDSVNADIKRAYAMNGAIVERRFAMTQEKVEQYYKRKADNAAALGVFLFIVGAGLIINDAIQDGKDASKVEWTAKDAQRSETRDILTASSLFAFDVISEESFNAAEENSQERQYVQHEIFPGQAIVSGQGARGKIYFTIFNPYRYHRVVIPIGETDFVLDFRKRKSADRQSLKTYDMKLHGWN